GPVKRLPELPRDGAFRIVTVATQVAEVDATAQHKDRDEQRSKKLPLWLTEAGYLFQDVINYGHKPFTGSSGSGMRSPHLTSSRLRLFTPFAQKCPKCCHRTLPVEGCDTLSLLPGHTRWDLLDGLPAVSPPLPFAHLGCESGSRDYDRQPDSRCKWR